MNAVKPQTMQLWTYHRRGFPVDVVSEIDHAKSVWWDFNVPGFRYRNVVLHLWELIGTKDFLWCDVFPGGRNADPSEDEWELCVPICLIISLYRPTIWDNLLWGRTDDWSSLLVAVGAEQRGEEIGALVRLPLPPGSAVNRGPLPLNHRVRRYG